MARQRDFYDWATLAVAVLGIVLVTAGTWIAASEARTSREQLAIMYRQDQAWIQTSLKARAFVDPATGNFDMEYQLSLENAGGRPAGEVRQTTSVTDTTEDRNACDRNSSLVGTAFHLTNPTSIGPGEVIQERRISTLAAADKETPRSWKVIRVCTVFNDFEGNSYTLLTTDFFAPYDLNEIRSAASTSKDLDVFRQSQFAKRIPKPPAGW